ncbi:MAG: hypothetical protein ACRC10_12030 [Thermoguttaceae bacterium]
MKTRVSCFLLSLFVFSVFPLFAADSSVDAIDFFDAIDQGIIDARIIAKNSLDGQMVVVNKTKETVLVHKPFAYAAVPVVAQFGGGMGGGGMGGGMGGGSMGGRSGGGSQSMGGGMGGMSGGMGGMGGGMGGMGGGGMMSIPAERVVRENVKTVCLEYGKREPYPKIRYEVKPISEFSQDKELAVLCAMVGTGQIDSQSAQAATWFVTGDLNWDALGQLTQKTVRGPVPQFSPEQLALAQQTVVQVKSIVENIKTEGKSDTPEDGTTSQSR